MIKVTEARKAILKEGKESGKNDYVNIENVGNTPLHVVVSNDKGHISTVIFYKHRWSKDISLYQ
jgi:hypothetical protein